MPINLGKVDFDHEPPSVDVQYDHVDVNSNITPYSLTDDEGNTRTGYTADVVRYPIKEYTEVQEEQIHALQKAVAELSDLVLTTE